MSKDILLYDKSNSKDSINYKYNICIDDLKLYKYFMRTHKMCRELNKKLLMRYKDIPEEMHISLLKLSDKIIFESMRILEIIKDLNKKEDKKTIFVKTKYNNLLMCIIEIMEYDLVNVKFEKSHNLAFKTNFKYFVFSILLLFNSIFVKREKAKNIFIGYNDKVSFEFFKPYNLEAIYYPMYNKSLNIKTSNYKVDKYINRKFITYRAYVKLLKSYFKNYLIVKKSFIPIEVKKLYINNLFKLEVQSALVYSLKFKFKNLKNIIGIFDTNEVIDYITTIVNKSNIKTICTPHGINFKYKVSYISYGTNIYTLWSKNHYERMNSSNLSDKDRRDCIITGNIVYKNTLMHLQKENIFKKNILVVGEYFSTDNFYSSPFNQETTRIFFDTLKEFVLRYKDVNVTIRTRLNDGYYELAKQYISNNIKISSPQKSIIEEINENDLVIAVFSNALHEGLLLEKKVLQVNLLGIENYRDLAEKGLVYYADTKEKFFTTLTKWYFNKLPKLDYQKHLIEYANNGKFKKIDLD